MSDTKTGVIPDIAEDARATGIPCHKTTIEVPGNLKGFIASLHQRKGTLQLTATYLLSLFANELKRNNIVSYDPDRYEDALAGVSVTIGPPRSAVADARAQHGLQVSSGEDRRGTSSVAQPSAGPAELPNASSPPPSRRRKG